MITWEKRIYPYLPVIAQNLACSYYGWRESRLRFNDRFHALLESLMASQNLSLSEIRAYQDEKIRALIEHAYANVPYYREIMQERKLVPSDVRSVGDLPKLPILTKEAVRENAHRLLATNVSKKQMILMHTSGTTGKSLHFYVSPESIAFRWAIWWRHRLRFGVKPGDWHVNFTGQRVVPLAQTKPPYWRWNLAGHQVHMNMQHMTPAKTPAIAEFLSHRDFVYFSGYPSIIHALAQQMMELNLTLSRKPRFVITGAENMFEFQKRDIERITGAVCTDQYGFSEGCGNASQCTAFAYHEDFEFGILEKPSTDNSDRRVGILATGFASAAFPFIRYEVGDVGVWADSGRACACGLQSPRMTRIEGRMDDYILTPEGRRIMRFDYLFKDTQNIKECQINQRVPEAIEVLVVRRPDYASKDEEVVRHAIAEWISPLLRVDFQYTDEIERESNGKFRAVRSFLNSKRL